MSKKIGDGPEGKRESRPEEQDFRVEGGALLIWKPTKHGTRDVPCVTVGHFRNGVPAINFRKYHVTSPLVLAPSQEGIALSFLELDGIMDRLRAVMVRPDEKQEGAADVAA